MSDRIINGVKFMGFSEEIITFFRDATEPTFGIFDVRNANTLSINIEGTATTSVVKFYAIGVGPIRELMGTRLSDFELGVQGKIGEMWQFTIAGVGSVEIVLDTVSGGNVTVLGKAV